MSHMVTCRECKKKFDANKEAYYLKSQNWYYCQECWGKIEEETEYTKKIHELMQTILQDEYNRAKINNQIKSLKEERKSVKGIYYTLDYWYNIKKSDSSKANGGIGIVSYIWRDSCEYWRQHKDDVANFQHIPDSAVKASREMLKESKAQTKRFELEPPKHVVYFDLD